MVFLLVPLVMMDVVIKKAWCRCKLQYFYDKTQWYFLEEA